MGFVSSSESRVCNASFDVPSGVDFALPRFATGKISIYVRFAEQSLSDRVANNYYLYFPSL